MSSCYKSRSLPSPHKEERLPTFEEFEDVKRACHRWLMKNDMVYRKTQFQLPDRKKLKDWDEDVDAKTKALMREKKESLFF